MDYKEIKLLYCKWCPNEQVCDDDLTEEEKLGCVASGGFVDEFINIRMDCEHYWDKTNGIKYKVADCPKCQGKAGLSLGEVWELYQQGSWLRRRIDSGCDNRDTKGNR